MKKIKNYTSIWNVEKVIYALSDVNLPVPLTFTQIAWFMAIFMLVLMLQNLPPFSMIDSALIKFAVIPAGITWLMSQKTFDGKKPYSFLRSVFLYIIRSKETYAGKSVMTRNVTVKQKITTVRSEVCEAVSISN